MQTTPQPDTSTLSVPEDVAFRFRQVWRGFGSAVALIATEFEGQRHAMLATAATSVSMEPPSILVCVNRSASSHSAICARGAFSLGILPAEHHSIGNSIARSSARDRFLAGTWQENGSASAVNGLPYLDESVATLFCEIDLATEYGTHTIFIAKVAEVVGDLHDDPLLYCDGRYGRFEDLVQ